MAADSGVREARAACDGPAAGPDGGSPHRLFHLRFHVHRPVTDLQIVFERSDQAIQGGIESTADSGHVSRIAGRRPAVKPGSQAPSGCRATRGITSPFL